MADETSLLLRLPDELLEAIVSALPAASDIVAFGRACQRTHKATCAPHLWRPRCVGTWRYWEEWREIAAKFKLPPGKTDWKQLYNERARIDREALGLFNDMLSTQKSRNSRMEQIAAHRYDVKDLLLKLKDHTPDDAEDVLARRYFARETFGRMLRGIAVETWMRLQLGEPVKLEEALGAFDLFVHSPGEEGDLRDIVYELDVIACFVKDRYKMENKAVDPDADFDHLTIRQKAVRIVQYLRALNLVGKSDTIGYHALRNNFIGLSLFNLPHSSLPLQSAAIYCAVAERLGVDAHPSNYPGHVYAVIKAPAGQTLDGGERRASSSSPAANTDTDTEVMYLDPWSTSDEVSPNELRRFLFQHHIDIPPEQHDLVLGPATTLEIVIRMCKNIATSTQAQFALNRIPVHERFPDAASARYATLWALMVFCSREPEDDGVDPGIDAGRRHFLSHMLDHYGAQFSQDIGIFAAGVGEGRALFPDEPHCSTYANLIEREHAADRAGKHPRPRDAEAKSAVKYAVGQYFRHRRYGYTGFVIGWDRSCSAAPSWIDQMGVLDLPGGAEQPFYHIMYVVCLWALFLMYWNMFYFFFFLFFLPFGPPLLAS